LIHRHLHKVLNNVLLGGAMTLADDPHWQTLTDPGHVCPSCGVAHGGLFDLAMQRPDIWSGDNFVDNQDVRADGHCLSEDLCVLDGQHYFVRGVLLLPIKGANHGEDFGFGVWSSLSRENFLTYQGIFHDGPDDPQTRWFSWFANDIKGYPSTLNLQCHVRPQIGNSRPLIELEPTDHPLAIDQHEGISTSRIIEIYAENGHDFGR